MLNFRILAWTVILLAFVSVPLRAAEPLPQPASSPVPTLSQALPGLQPADQQPLPATTFLVTCWGTCDDGQATSAGCNQSLSTCCRAFRKLACPAPSHFQSGECTDGTTTLTC
jgi:hypothetical protein